jgi:hypothetical protein
MPHRYETREIYCGIRETVYAEGPSAMLRRIILKSMSGYLHKFYFKGSDKPGLGLRFNIRPGRRASRPTTVHPRVSSHSAH